MYYLCAMNLNEIKQRAVEAMGFDRLNVMQEKMLEVAASGRNVMLLSPTGTGKTVAFLLPLMAQQMTDGMLTMIVVPSRELAQQISDVAKKLGLRTVLCYGGHDPRIECQRLEALAPAGGIIVGTSGRIKDHIERGRIDLNRVSHLVLDEYDKMLELGFEEELRFIVAGLKSVRQTILTSATHSMPLAPWLNFKPYEQLDFTSPVTGLKVMQVKSPVPDKLDTLDQMLASFLSTDASSQVIVFSNYRESSERIAHHLSEMGIANALYHGGMEQDLRDKALIRFRAHSVRVLVSTDLASRGLDIPDVSHIVHYHLPADLETFTHRNGRTARNGAEGTAYLIIGPNEFVPEFIGDNKVPFFTVSAKRGAKQAILPAEYALVYVGRGRREKISKGDILGFFTRNGGIDGSSIGRIEVMEHCAYCAISQKVVGEVLQKVRGLKIKGEKTIYKVVEGN